MPTIALRANVFFKIIIKIWGRLTHAVRPAAHVTPTGVVSGADVFSCLQSGTPFPTANHAVDVLPWLQIQVQGFPLPMRVATYTHIQNKYGLISEKRLENGSL